MLTFNLDFKAPFNIKRHKNPSRVIKNQITLHGQIAKSRQMDADQGVKKGY